ncbi:PAS domain-containing protein [Rhizobium sp. CECT 9324]|uniref:PAS domain-containing sensor histidine kinase n=1 Tax=Rhizobium sp. CECT 9324 TaxID=2845820 RepID=UPI001E4C6AFD|nr:PAS domain-containing protein [Rhizobium sp. CECT 9324]CAH0340843.1 Adaptive-response sensory-kinase SasA [Rhizobium sp. CECT 9324]
MSKSFLFKSTANERIFGGGFRLYLYSVLIALAGAIFALAQTSAGLLPLVTVLFIGARRHALGSNLTTLFALGSILSAVALLTDWPWPGEYVARDLLILCVCGVSIGIILVQENSSQYRESTNPDGDVPVTRSGQENLSQQNLRGAEIDRKAVGFAESRAFWTGVTQVMRFRVQQPDGTFQWTEVRVEPAIKSSLEIGDLAPSKDISSINDPLAFLAPSTDVVTAAKTIENLFGNGWAFDAVGNWIYLPAFAQSTLETTPEELNTSRSEGFISWRQLLHPDEYESVAQAWIRSLETGEPFNSEFRIRRKSGYAWARSSARAVRDTDGSIKGWYGTSIDIDVHRKTVDALRDREQELLEIVNLVPSHLWRLGPDGEPNFFNRRMVDYLGIDVGGIRAIGQSRLCAMITSTIHPDDQGLFREGLERAISSGSGFSARYRLRRSDGLYRWMSSRAEALRDRNGQILQWYGLCHDIDDHVQAEEALQRSEWHLQQVVEALPVHVCTWTPAGELLYVSKRYRDELGLEKNTTLTGFARAILRCVHPDDVQAVRLQAADGVAKRQAFSMRYRRRVGDNYRWTDGRFEALRRADGSISEWFGLSIDIDNEIRIQETLRESERSLRQLVESLPALIYCADPEGKPIYRSQRLREFLGVELEEGVEPGGLRLEATLDAIIHPDDLEAVREKYAHSLKTGDPYLMKHRLRRHDGEYRWVETRTAAMRSAGGDVVQWNGVCLDIDDWIKDQEQLGLAQRNLARANQAASLAELTASIAHEIGQPLAALVSSSDACQQWLSADPPNLERAQKALERVVRSAGTAIEVVSRIRALFRHSNDARQITSFSKVLMQARELMAEEAARRRVLVKVDADDDLPLVSFDRIQVQQVLVNLVRNGLEAAQGAKHRGTLIIRIRRLDGSLQVEVRDNGPGIEFPDRVFEPFFTTKEEGMGMGLAICRTIVQAHGGRLWAENNATGGASFFFTLPVEEAHS